MCLLFSTVDPLQRSSSCAVAEESELLPVVGRGGRARQAPAPAGSDGELAPRLSSPAGRKRGPRQESAQGATADGSQAWGAASFRSTGSEGELAPRSSSPAGRSRGPRQAPTQEAAMGWLPSRAPPSGAGIARIHRDLTRTACSHHRRHRSHFALPSGSRADEPSAWTRATPSLDLEETGKSRPV